MSQPVGDTQAVSSRYTGVMGITEWPEEGLLPPCQVAEWMTSLHSVDLVHCLRETRQDSHRSCGACYDPFVSDSR